MGTKRSINRKAIYEIAERELAAGKSKESILEELAEQYYDRNTLANYIGSIPDPELKKRYGTANTILFALLVVATILNILVVVALVLSGQPTPLLLLAPVVSIISIRLAVEVRKARGYSYWLITMLAILGIISSFRGTHQSEIVMIVDIVLLASIGGLSIYIADRMFPHLRFGRIPRNHRAKTVQP